MNNTRRKPVFKVIKTQKGFVVMDKNEKKSSYYHTRCEAENAKKNLMVA